MRRVFTFLVALAFLALTASAWADVPTEMSVQGRLTNGAGAPVPAGFKNFTFKIYDAPVGGLEIWPGGPGETQLLSTDANGLWNAGVGTLIPLTEAVFLSPVRWLEVTVNDGVNPIEILPRIELRTNPYTYRSATSQQADSLAGLSLGDLGDLWVDEVGDTMTGPLGNLYTHKALGSSVVIHNSNDGWTNYWNDFFGTWGLSAMASGDNTMWNVGLAGSALGNNNTNDANYGVLGYADGSGSLNVAVQGLTGGSGTSNYSGLFYGGDFFVSSTLTPGTNGVILPADAIDDTEILDEPGLTAGEGAGPVPITSAMTDMATTTITIPTDGYIHLVGTMGLETTGNAGAGYGYAQIDETGGGTIIGGYWAAVGYSIFPNAGFFDWSMTVQRIYAKSAGTYTFRLEAMETYSTVGATNGHNPRITAMFLPTSYGTVSTVVDASEASEFEHSTLQSQQEHPEGSAAHGVLADGYVVDLRELELKVAKAEAEVERARREFIEAKLSSSSGPLGKVGNSVKEPKQ